MASLPTAFLPSAVPRTTSPPAAAGPRWLLTAIIVLVVAYEPLFYHTGIGAYAAVSVAVFALLGRSFLVSFNKPIKATWFDITVFTFIAYILYYYLVGIRSGITAMQDAWRGLQLLAYITLFYTVFSTCSRNPALFSQALRVLTLCLIGTCVFGVLQLVGQQTGLFDLFPEYARTREFRTVWQVTAQFGEPAMLGQFLVACLFILFADIRDIRERWALLALTLATVALTQSTGALVGLVAWALFLLVYNRGVVLSTRRLGTKLAIVAVLAVAGVVAFKFSRLPLDELFLFQRLDGSGQQRVYGELRPLQYLIEQGRFESLLFGLGDIEARNVRAVVGFSAEVAGNALVELVLRHGLVAAVLLLVLFGSIGLGTGTYLAVIFALLGQIDGAVAKPFLWLYAALIALSLVYRRRARQRPDRPAPVTAGRGALRSRAAG